MDQSFWQNLAANAPEENTGFENLPADTYFAMRTAGVDNGKAAPEVRVKEVKNGDRAGEEYRQFSVGLMAIGAAAPGTDKNEGGMVYLDAFLEPGEKEMAKKPGQAIAGRFTGLLNTFFAAGVAEAEKDAEKRAAARWAVTVSKLQKVAETSGLSIDQYEGNVARYMAGLAVKALEAEPARLIIKTKLDTYKQDGITKSSIKVGSFEDFTPANIEKRKIKMFGQTNGKVEY